MSEALWQGASRLEPLPKGNVRQTDSGLGRSAAISRVMNESLPDQDLLRDFTERRSESAFQALVQRHADLVFGTALRQVGQAAAAEEVVQEVFIALARKAVWMNGESSLAEWLYKTTLLKSRQWWRGESRRPQREQVAVELNTTMKDDGSVSSSLAGVLDEGLLHVF